VGRSVCVCVCIVSICVSVCLSVGVCVYVYVCWCLYACSCVYVFSCVSRCLLVCVWVSMYQSATKGTHSIYPSLVLSLLRSLCFSLSISPLSQGRPVSWVRMARMVLPAPRDRMGCLARPARVATRATRVPMERQVCVPRVHVCVRMCLRVCVSVRLCKPIKMLSYRRQTLW